MNFSITDLFVLSLLAIVAAGYAAVRVGAMFDVELDSSPAKDARDRTGARSRRASRWGN
jgi:hypothetical protein